MSHGVFLETGTGIQNLGYQLVCSGYLVHKNQVLLVHHDKFDMWVPPGGHVEPGETFAQAAEREFLEETGIRTQALLNTPQVHVKDAKSSPTPVPFYVDVEKEDFTPPAIVQFYYMRALSGQDLGGSPQLSEVRECRWFTNSEISTIESFDQVRSVARFALTHHPDAH